MFHSQMAQYVSENMISDISNHHVTYDFLIKIVTFSSVMNGTLQCHTPASRSLGEGEVTLEIPDVDMNPFSDFTFTYIHDPHITSVDRTKTFFR